MIEATRPTEPNSLQEGTQIQATHQAPVFQTELFCSRRNTPFTNFLNWAGNKLFPVLNQIWDWFRFNILFLIFDEKEEKLQQMKKANAEFTDLYFRHANTPRDSDVSAMKKGFKKLTPEHQTRIKQGMFEILKQFIPGRSSDAYRKKVDAVLEYRPFAELEFKGEKEKKALLVLSLFQLSRDLFDELN